jgi:tetratricopeptide (TPR) repeat protein
MGRRYAQRGYNQRAMHSCRVDLELFRGDLAAAKEAYNRRRENRRDQMADCPACESGFEGVWHEWNDRDEEALTAWRPVLEGQLTCAEEPHRILSRSLLPLVRVGRPGQARANHVLGYPMVRGRPNLRASVGRHLEYAALTGNEARALEILAEHAAWLAPDDGSPGSRLTFLGAVAVLLRRLSALGHEDLPVATPTGPAPVSELRPRVEEQLAAIAAAYDARNGTTAVTDRLAARLGHAPLPDPLASGPLRMVAAGDARRRLAASEERVRAGLRDGAPTIGHEPAGQLALQVAEAVWEQGGHDDAVVDVALLAAERLRERDPGGAARATALAGYALQRQGSRHAREAIALIEAALPDLERHAGEPDIVRARHGLHLALSARGSHRRAAQEVLTAAAIAAGWPDQRRHAALLYEAGQAWDAAGEHEESQRTYERASALWLEAGEPADHIRATRAAAWARWRRSAPDWPGALAQLRAARAAADGPALRAERYETTYQIAQLLQYRTRTRGCPDGTAEEGLAEADAAAAGFADLGDHSKAAGAQLVAAELEKSLGRTAEAGARAVAVRADAVARKEGDLVRRCDRFVALLTHRPA